MPLEWRGAIHTVSRVVSGNDRKIEPVSLRNITDGTSNSLMLGEYHTLTRPRRRAFWAYGYASYSQSDAFPESRTFIADLDKCESLGGGGIFTCLRAWGALHAGGLMQFASCDGSVRTVTPEVDVERFAAAATIANAEALNLDAN